MKKETKLEKLHRILGLETKVEEVKIKKSNLNKVVYVKEDEIQEFRAIQGTKYFLQAPELFQFKVCKHCKEQFLVSRQFVSCCSYTCIRLDLEEIGIAWNKGKDLEALALDKNVYDGNEPIWIKEPQLSQLRKALEVMTVVEPA